MPKVRMTSNEYIARFGGGKSTLFTRIYRHGNKVPPVIPTVARPGFTVVNNPGPGRGKQLILDVEYEEADHED